MSKLALLGGEPVRSTPFATQNSIGEEEKHAVMAVLDSGVLSQFLGEHHSNFYGGPKVRELEEDWAKFFGINHAVTMNSATSALYAAVGAVGVGPGDEVIVSPYTMAASASCILGYNAIPVFADIDEDIFCITGDSIRRVITPHTKAIVVVHIFGHPADMDGIMEGAREHHLSVIEDTAQAPLATYKGKYAGTIGDIGVFSLNYHKHIHTGEGGVAVTNNPDLAQRLQLIRNHAEVVVDGMGVTNLVNMLGWNYRMTEIEAAIGVEQLKKLPLLVEQRVESANYLTERLSDLPGIIPPEVRSGCSNVYYLYAMKCDESRLGLPRDLLVDALRAEGVPITKGYVRPIYLEPLYQQRIVFGTKGCPFTCSHYEGSVDYSKGICPVTERMYDRELMLTSVCHAQATRRDIDDVVSAFEKVLEYRGELLLMAQALATTGGGDH